MLSLQAASFLREFKSKGASFSAKPEIKGQAIMARRIMREGSRYST
jgi:hypothetical protein